LNIRLRCWDEPKSLFMLIACSFSRILHEYGVYDVFLFVA
jgi:hypothetical protein